MTNEILMDEILNDEELDAVNGGKIVSLTIKEIRELANKEVKVIVPPVPPIKPVPPINPVPPIKPVVNPLYPQIIAG